MLLTPHSSFDLDRIMDASALLFDARNATGARGRANVVTL